MELSIPPEPLELKKTALEKAGSREWSFLPKERVYNLYVMAGSGLPKYLWSEWRDSLKSAGLSWQVFQKIISACERDIHLWIEDKESWDHLVTKVIVPVIEKAIRGDRPLWPP